MASDQWLPARSGSQTKFLLAVMLLAVVMVSERYQMASQVHAASPIALCCLPSELSGKNRAFFFLKFNENMPINRVSGVNAMKR